MVDYRDILFNEAKRKKIHDEKGLQKPLIHKSISKKFWREPKCQYIILKLHLSWKALQRKGTSAYMLSNTTVVLWREGRTWWHVHQACYTPLYLSQQYYDKDFLQVEDFDDWNGRNQDKCIPEHFSSSVSAILPQDFQYWHFTKASDLHGNSNYNFINTVLAVISYLCWRLINWDCSSLSLAEVGDIWMLHREKHYLYQNSKLS